MGAAAVLSLLAGWAAAASMRLAVLLILPWAAVIFLDSWH